MDNVEQQLLSIWQAIIHSEAINPHENLLDQGGNSLHFIKLASMVSKTFNLSVSPRTFSLPELLLRWLRPFGNGKSSNTWSWDYQQTGRILQGILRGG